MTIINSSFDESIEIPQVEYIDFAFMDSCHNYEQTKNGLNIFWTAMKPGGKVWFHDWNIGFDDRDRAILEFVKENNLRCDLLCNARFAKLTK